MDVKTDNDILVVNGQYWILLVSMGILIASIHNCKNFIGLSGQVFVLRND